MKLIMLLAVLVFSGCSTAGPFVTNLSADGAGRINVEKCMVKMNAFLGVVSNTECGSTSISVNGQAAAAK